MPADAHEMCRCGDSTANACRAKGCEGATGTSSLLDANGRPMPADAPTPTREEVVAWLRFEHAGQTVNNAFFEANDAWYKAICAMHERGIADPREACARAALARLTPDPWAEVDAGTLAEAADMLEDYRSPYQAAAVRRARLRLLGVPVTEDGR